MQNTIVREFDGDPDVVPVIFDQGGANGETRAWLETFWTNYFLRGGVIWDETGAVGAAYGQPSTGLPFGRGFIIDREGNVELAYFGHQPQMAIAHLRAMLAAGSAPDDAGSPPGRGSPDRATRGEGLRIVSVQPNPARDRVTILAETGRAGTLTWELYDAGGRRAGVGRLEAESSGTTQWTLPLVGPARAGAAAGRYFLRVRDGTGQAAAPIVRVR